VTVTTGYCSDGTERTLAVQVSTPARRTLGLEPPRSWQMLDLAELRHYRELLFFFIWRDVKLRYEQTVQRTASSAAPISSPRCTSRSSPRCTSRAF